MIVGLTGGIGSGKSLCSDYFLAQGFPTVDADVIAREVVKTGSPLLWQLTELLGTSILTEAGALCRPRLREILFRDQIKRKQVEQLMHPAIREESLRQLSLVERRYPLVFYTVPLLFENALQSFCAVVVLVDVSPDLQIRRAACRDDVSQEQIMRIIHAQMPRLNKIKLTNFIIDNCGEKAQTLRQCEALLARLQSLCGA